MLKILGKIFNPSKLGESVTSGIDKSILTKEEKLDYMQRMLVLYEPFKLAQRILSIMFSACFLLIHLLTAITHFTYVLRGKDATAIISLYSYNNDSLGTIVLMVVGFYFAGGVMSLNKK